MTDAEIDLIIVGGGLAGHCAALEAAAQDADVLMLEKEDKIGGSTVLSGGSFAFAGTDLQEAEGISDSEALLFDDFRKVGGRENDPDIVQAYVDHQRDTYAWLKRQGVVFENVFIAGGQSVARCHRTNPRAVMDALSASVARNKNIEVKLSTPVRRLLKSNGQSRIEGVSCETENGIAEIRSRHGVVLANGGFSRNEALLKLFAPAQSAAQRMGGRGNTGDGLLMAWEHGAGFRDMGYIKGTFGSHPSAGPEEYKPLLAIYKGGIAINVQGKRFINEALSYKIIGDACLAQSKHIAYQLFDAAVMRKSIPGVPAFDFQRALRDGLLAAADSWEDLASKIDADSSAMLATISDYNAAVASGGDQQFGRAGLSNEDYGELIQLIEPPFYAYACTSTVLATYCGLSVNAGMAVLDVWSKPIKGLYAAGEVVGGLHGIGYLSGSANGKAAIFGRLSARTAIT